MTLLKNIYRYLTAFLAPEEKRLARVLSLDPYDLLAKLPKPRKTHLEEVNALFDYRDKNVRLLIKALKYKANRETARRLGLYLYDEILEMALETALFDGNIGVVVLPMPASPGKQATRGWNQCQLLAQQIEKLSKLHGNTAVSVKYNLLEKIRKTKKQADLERAERLQNVKNSMVAKKMMGNKNSLFIVLDDVYTTGATYREARRALREAGVKKIMGLFVAH